MPEGGIQAVYAALALGSAIVPQRYQALLLWQTPQLSGRQDCRCSCMPLPRKQTA